MNESETCCGFGGTFSVKYESIAVGMAEQKIINVEATKASTIISTDLSCLMHMDGYLKKQGKNIRVMHIADVLASGWCVSRKHLVLALIYYIYSKYILSG